VEYVKGNMTELENWIAKAITHMSDIHRDYKKRAEDSFAEHDKNLNINEYERQGIFDKQVSELNQQNNLLMSKLDRLYT